MLKISVKIICLFLLSINPIYSFASCLKKDSNRKVIENKVVVPQKSIVKNLFYNVPSPIEVTEIIKEMNLPYQSDIMNSVNNADNYLS